MLTESVLANDDMFLLVRGLAGSTVISAAADF